MEKKKYPEIITPEEVAEYLRVTRQTIYNLIWRKEIPAYKVGTHWRLKKDEVESWLKTKTEKDTKQRK
jgi:excisionase family DNA binding protein